MRFSALALIVAAMPLAAQHDISKVEPVSPDAAVSTPIPDGRRMKKYDIPDLAGAQQALGSLLIDGRLRKPLVDFMITEGDVVQRISLFEKGLVVVDMTGAATIRKKLIIPEDSLQTYLEVVNADRLESVQQFSLSPPQPKRRALIRVYREDGAFVEREFHPAQVLPKNLGDQITPLRDLLRAISEDRTVTSSVAGYLPSPGDELVADDQTTWRVVRVVEPSGVVELKGLDQPTTIFVSRDDLHLYFIGRRAEANAD
jgi:hypothetical protein